ncbi:uncharacterized protein LOC134276580 [Saccostrea cucullata]|uniref:uncharacterized protein LOC134276580 n=1 Tax=Saccostrea cuccullata TaxID=36930 RepID=UPI002ED1F08D
MDSNNDWIPPCFQTTCVTEFHILGWVNNDADLNTVLEAHKRSSLCSFVTWSDDKKKKEKKKRRIVWQHEDVNTGDSICPFTVDRSVVLTCQFGKGRKANAALPTEDSQNSDHVYEKKKRFLIQNSRKVGCDAKLHIRYITSYDNYNLPTSAGRGAKEREMDRLENDIQKKNAPFSNKIHLRLPLAASHTKHTVSIESAFANRMHIKLKERIREHVKMGITSVAYIRKMLKSFVEKEMNSEDCVSPSTNDRSYFPTNRDIRNCVHAALVKGQYSGLDQENLQKKIEEWQKEDPEDMFFYRHCTRDQVSASSIKKTEKIFASDDEEDDDLEDEEVSGTEKNTFLFVHQSKHQQELLKKYGELVLIDATYKTTKYALPLFLLVVRTNVSYVPVAEFIVETERTENILEALQVIKSWNKFWEPRFFMMDYSHQEYQAIHELFPNASKYLCTFHVEQAWIRWCKQRENNLSESDKDTLLDALRDMARAPSVPLFQKARDSLINLSVFTENEKVKTYLETRWLNIPERWCRAFWSEGFHICVTTNNGVEALNNSLKNFYAKLTSTGTLTSLIEIIVKDFIPDLIRTYLHLNYQYTSQYKKYNDCIPAFLQNKPRSVVKHCLVRYASAGEYCSGDLENIGQNMYKVKSQSRDTEHYNVHLGTDETATKCSCQDFITSFLPCKHIFAVIRFTHHTWESLSPLYRQSPYLNLDSTVLSDKAMEQIENKSEIQLPADFVLEVPTKEELSELSENNQQKQIIKSRSELRNNIKVLDDLTFLSSSENDLSEVNTMVLKCIECLQGSVDVNDKLPLHRGSTVQMKTHRQLPQKRKQKKKKIRKPFLKVKDPNVYGVIEKEDHHSLSEVIQDR